MHGFSQGLENVAYRCQLIGFAVIGQIPCQQAELDAFGATAQVFHQRFKPWGTVLVVKVQIVDDREVKVSTGTRITREKPARPDALRYKRPGAQP
jgi:hypothetical protein